MTARSPTTLRTLVLSFVLGTSVFVSFAPGTAVAAEVTPGDPVPGDLNSDGTARVVFVGDSIMEGAAAEITEAIRSAGYEVVVDTAVSRSTLAGENIVRLYAATEPDAMVVMLGANDAGNPDSFRKRVRAVVAAAQGVPLLMWMTIPEVRDYYPGANDIIREELAARRGGAALEWADVAAAQGVTSGDGLHLTPSGKETMTRFVVPTVVAAARSAQKASIPADRTTSPPSGGANEERSAIDSTNPASGDDTRSDLPDQTVGVADSANTLLGRNGVFTVVLLVAGVLACAGIGIALWSLWNTRALNELDGRQT